ncbi:MAG: nitrilase-related carbon-nitrogen hydrolase [Streptosporangiaceae bacterium]
MTAPYTGTTAPAAIVACCQVAPVLGDPRANRELAAEAVAQAAASGASVIVLPELLSSGYVFESRAEANASAEPPDGETVQLWQRLSAGHNAIIVAGFAEAGGTDASPYNSAVLIDRGELRCVYRKAHLWDAERLWFTPGSAAPPLIPTEYGLLSVMICYDLEFPEWVRLPALAGAQLLCAPVNWPAAPRPAGERAPEIARVQADAGVNRMFVAACDRTGTERAVEWVAGSIINHPDGWLLAEAPHTESMIVAECDLAQARDKRVSKHSDIHADRRPELYQGLTKG